jgi:hypothetical protein
MMRTRTRFAMALLATSALGGNSSKLFSQGNKDPVQFTESQLAEQKQWRLPDLEEVR